MTSPDSPSATGQGVQAGLDAAGNAALQQMRASWGDMDFNQHMRNTAYLDRSGDSRMLFFAAHGFPMKEFIARRIGPVVMRDELEYFREIALLETFTVKLEMAGLAADGSRMHMRNLFERADGKLAARVLSVIGWIDMNARKLVAPPAALLEVLRRVPRSTDHQELS